MDENFWNVVREEYPITREYAYFQSAGMSPMPNRVLKAVYTAYEKVNLYGDMFWLDELKRSDNLKGKLAGMINTGDENITFAHNTSTAFTFVAAALKAGHKKKFNLVSLWDEFPSTNIPFEFQGIPLKFVKPEKGIYTIDKILEAVDEDTLGVVCSYVQYATGFRLDLEELGWRLDEKNLLFIVNATQAFPIFEVDVQKMKIDVLTVSFHKWGSCAHVGSLFYTSGAFRKTYPNPMAGWLSVHPAQNDFIPTHKNEGYRQYQHAGQYDFGTMNYQAVSALDVAIDFMHEVGLDNIRQRIKSLMDYLVKELGELPVEIVSPVKREHCRSAIVLIDLPGKNNAEAVEFLKKYKVIVTIRAEKIRISVNFFNNFKEVDRLVEILTLFVG